MSLPRSECWRWEEDRVEGVRRRVLAPDGYVERWFEELKKLSKIEGRELGTIHKV